MKTGLQKLLETPDELSGRRYALLANPACSTANFEPIHLALAKSAQPPTLLMGPEHGFYSVEQDMIASVHEPDPWTGLPIHSLYGDSEGSLRPRDDLFDGLDLLLIDLQDVGARYYTYAATALWCAEVALANGCEVWLLDRPNPLGGCVVEGNHVQPGFHSFVGAFDLPVRHGLTLGELVRLEAKRRSLEDIKVVPLSGWSRSQLWPETGQPWRAPSPNLPRFSGAVVYPGLCLIEATELSEGRGTTRPFELVGAPGVDPLRVADRLQQQQIPGVEFAPTYFRPQFQKHAGEVCGGVELIVTDAHQLPSLRLGVEVLAAFKQEGGEAFKWRDKPYEFVSDRPAIDLLSGGPELREALDSGVGLEAWVDTWGPAEDTFRAERAEILLYSETDPRPEGAA